MCYILSHLDVSTEINFNLAVSVLGKTQAQGGCQEQDYQTGEAQS